MYIKQLPNGKYKYGQWYIEYRTGKRRRVSITLDKDNSTTRREAQRILDEKVRERNDIAEPAEITLDAARKLYVEYQERTLKPSTAGRCKVRIGVLTRILGPDTRLASLSAGYINRAFLASGRKKSTLNEDLVRLKAWIRWCYENDLIEDIRFLDKLKPYKVDKKPEKEKYMEGDELRRLLPALKVPLNRLIIEFLALSGCRVGEAMALEWSDIGGDVIHVAKTYDNINRVTTSTKTEKSCRDIYIQPELRALIGRIREYYMLIGVRSDLVFATERGNHPELRTIEKYFKENTEKILGRRLTLHSLRHTHASLLFEQGMPLDAVSFRLGHADSRITKDIYLHVTERKKEQYNAQMEKISLLS